MELSVDNILKDHQLIKTFFEASPAGIDSKLCLYFNDGILFRILRLLLRYSRLHIGESPLEVVLCIEVTCDLLFSESKHLELHSPEALKFYSCIVMLVKNEEFLFSGSNLFFTMVLNMPGYKHFFKFKLLKELMLLL